MERLSDGDTAMEDSFSGVLFGCVVLISLLRACFVNLSSNGCWTGLGGAFALWLRQPWPEISRDLLEIAVARGRGCRWQPAARSSLATIAHRRAAPRAVHHRAV